MSKILFLHPNRTTLIAWQRFKSSLAGDYSSNFAWCNNRDEVLKKNHRAELKYDAARGYGSYLEFETEKDAMWFMLRWA